MNIKSAIAAAGAAVAGTIVSAVASDTFTTPLDTEANSLYDFTMKDIDGKERPLKQFAGKVVVVVNVASKCGLTPQYEGLEKLYKEHKEAGLVVLGFPANDFRGQEPGTDSEIKEFCSTNYSVTFPMFSKISVKGETAHPLYRWLIAATDQKQDIEWNFAKFVVGRDGKVKARFAPRTAPNDPNLIAAIKSALAEKAD